MPDQQGFSYANWQAVNAAGYTLFTVGADTTNDANSVYFPSKGVISHVEVEMNTINPVIGAGGAPTTVTVVGMWDSNGFFLALPETSATISQTATSTARGGAILQANIQYMRPADGTERYFYVGVKIDAGTANARVRVYWRR